MDNKCPKCGGKLRVFDLKPECPHCGCNLMYYNMEARLEADAEKAEAEWAKVDALLYKLTPRRIRQKRERQAAEAAAEKKEAENENK